MSRNLKKIRKIKSKTKAFNPKIVILGFLIFSVCMTYAYSYFKTQLKIGGKVSVVYSGGNIIPPIDPEDPPIIEPDFEGRLGDFYKDGTIKDGDLVKYIPGSGTIPGVNWIVFGQDSAGNVLLTTDRPVDTEKNFIITTRVWLTYVDDLHALCRNYGSTIQNQNITGRSITLADINRVTGVQTPKFTTYKISDKSDPNDEFSVACWHPDINGEDYWSQSYVEYEYNTYYYDINGEYYSPSTGWETVKVNIKNPDLVFGPSGDYIYYIADTGFYYEWGYASYSIASVIDGIVNNYYCTGSTANEDYYIDDPFDPMAYFGLSQIRPVVVLPYSLDVEITNSVIDFKKE